MLHGLDIMGPGTQLNFAVLGSSSLGGKRHLPTAWNKLAPDLAVGVTKLDPSQRIALRAMCLPGDPWQSLQMSLGIVGKSWMLPGGPWVDPGHSPDAP